MEEIWKPVEGYEGIYSVSSFGKVRREIKANGTYSGYILKPRISTKVGRKTYGSVALHYNFRKDYLIATLVAQAFIGKKPENYQIDHKDCNKLNNRADNLEYVTGLENMKRARENNLIVRNPVRGSRNNFAKLKEDQVLEIRKNYVKREISHSAIAKRYNVSGGLITQILSRKIWKHI